jgi:hypothetical protein
MKVHEVNVEGYSNGFFNGYLGGNSASSCEITPWNYDDHGDGTGGLSGEYKILAVDYDEQ